MIALGGFLMIVFVVGFLMLAFFGEFEARRAKRREKEDVPKRSGSGVDCQPDRPSEGL